jgi:hypothetical protein
MKEGRGDLSPAPITIGVLTRLRHFRQQAGAAALLDAQHEPAPGQQQLPVEQQFSAFFSFLAESPVALLARSQQAP